MIYEIFSSVWNIVGKISTIAACIMLFSLTYEKYQLLFLDIEQDVRNTGNHVAIVAQQKLKNPFNRIIAVLEIFLLVIVLSRFDVVICGYHYQAGAGRMGK